MNGYPNGCDFKGSHDMIRGITINGVQPSFPSPSISQNMKNVH